MHLIAVANGDGSCSFNVDFDGAKRDPTITLDGDELVSMVEARRQDRPYRL